MCYVGGGDVSLARWEMNKPVCVRTEVKERNARREMSAAGGIGLWDTRDFSPAQIDKYTMHKRNYIQTHTKNQSVLKHTFFTSFRI